MRSRLTRSSLFVVLFVFVLLQFSTEAAADTIQDNGLSDLISLPLPTRTIHQIRRLTRNRVKDLNPIIDGDVIYWERFGDEEGDTEIYAFDVGPENMISLAKNATRLTNNNREDSLQDANVWISSPISVVPRDDNGEIISSVWQSPKYRRLSNHNTRRHEIFMGGERITQNRRQEIQVRVADNPDDGMVWLSRKIPRGYNSSFLTSETAYDVFWYDGQAKQTTRLTNTTDANALAFGGTWAVWSSPDGSDYRRFVQDKLTLHNVHTGETRVIDAEGPVNLQVSGQYVLYGSSAGNMNPYYAGDLFVVGNGHENRVMVYDTATDTTIEIGADPDLEFHRDMGGVLEGQYVAYSRSFVDPSIVLGVPQVYPYRPFPPDILELRLFDLETQTDILITEGQDIRNLHMDGNTLVWQMLDTSDPLEENWDVEIYAYDLLNDEMRQVTDNLIDEHGPQVSGDTIVWTTILGDGSTEIVYEKTYQTPDFVFVTLNEQEAMTRSYSEVVVANVPEPAAAILLGMSGLVMIGRGRKQ